MPTNPTEQVDAVLSDDEVALIESYLKDWDSGGKYPASWNDVRALCATVRALRADYALVENYLAEIKRELGLPSNTVLGVTLENYKERVTAPLREQLAQANSTISELRSEIQFLKDESP